MGENGRHRFASVRFVGEEGCHSDDLEEIAMMLKGKWLDEVDVEALKGMACRGSSQLREAPSRSQRWSLT